MPGGASLTPLSLPGGIHSDARPVRFQVSGLKRADEFLRGDYAQRFKSSAVQEFNGSVELAEP
jgi:hypothetical protein